MLCVCFTSIFRVFVWFLQLDILYILLCHFLLWFILGSLHSLYCTAGKACIKTIFGLFIILVSDYFL